MQLRACREIYLRGKCRYVCFPPTDVDCHTCEGSDTQYSTHILCCILVRAGNNPARRNTHNIITLCRNQISVLIETLRANALFFGVRVNLVRAPEVKLSESAGNHRGIKSKEQ